MNFPASLSADMSLSAALQIGSKIQIPNKQTASAGNLQAKAIIVSEDLPPLTIPCQFNPSTIHISKGANWRSPGQSNSASGKGSAPKWDVPYVQFEGGEAPSMSLDLLFDTTDSDERDVRIYTEPLISLTQIHTMGLDKDSQRPRLIRFIWGAFSTSQNLSFKAYAKSVDVTFTLFKTDGTPVRAEVKLTLIGQGDELQSQNPTSRSEARKMRVVLAGESLDWIAHQEYGNASHWKYIAQTNGLVNPMELRPGHVLKLLPLPEFS